VSPVVAIAKRILDLLGSTAALAFTLPIYPVIACAIRVDSPGPIFIRQRRAGRLLPYPPGEPPPRPGRFQFDEFDMFKFRSMRVDAEALTGPVLAAEGDPRITRVGRFLRKTRLDEIPQFWNVLKGDMSIVGPRPERPELLERISMAIPFFEERMRSIKPGITGLAQVSLGYSGRMLPGSELEALRDALLNPFDVEGADDAIADDLRIKLLYDLAYSVATEHFKSFAPLELKIIVKTPIVMLRSMGT
jgi:lipopolysaccharide/colanic/teichoic acid biosynthesis glycosyltransferase